MEKRTVAFEQFVAHSHFFHPSFPKADLPVQYVLQRARLNTLPPSPILEPLFEKVDDAQSELNALTEEIGGVEFILQQLEAHRKNIQTQIDAASSLISPVRKLPSDVLQQIFWLFASDVCEDHHPKGLSILGSVCYYWRDIIVYSSAHLWSVFQLRSRRDPQPFIERSGNHPLSISFHTRPSSLREIQDRVRSLTLTPGIRTDMISGFWPALERLTLLGQPLSVINQPTDHAPLLQHLSLTHSLRNILDGPGAFFPWAQLKSISLNDESWVDLAVKLIALCTSLQVLNITNCRALYYETLGDDFDITSNVTEISWYIRVHEDVDWIDSIFDAVSFPHLRLLNITRVPSAPTHLLTCEKLLSHFPAAGANLRVLRFQYTCTLISPEQLVVILSHVPALQELVYLEDKGFVGITNEVLKALSQQHAFVPDLHHLHLETHNMELDEGILVNMICDRAANNTLKSFDLGLTKRSLSDEAFRRLRSLRGSGVGVQLRDMDGCLFTRKNGVV